MSFAATWIALKTLILSEVSQEEKDKYRMISRIWNLIYGTTNLSIEKKSMNLENRLVVTKVGGSGMDWEVGVIYANYCIWSG